MTAKRRKPPALAIWLLQHSASSDTRDALLGDVLERFHRGKSSGWVWREVAICLLLRIGRAVRMHTGEILFALVATMVAEAWSRSYWARVLWQSSAMQSAFGWGVGWRFPLSAIYALGFDSMMAFVKLLPPLIALWCLNGSWRRVRISRILSIGFLVSMAEQFSVFLLPRNTYFLSPASFFLAFLICAMLSCGRAPRSRAAAN